MSEETVNNVQEIHEEVSTSEGDANKANLMTFDDLDNLTAVSYTHLTLPTKA